MEMGVVCVFPDYLASRSCVCVRAQRGACRNLEALLRPSFSRTSQKSPRISMDLLVGDRVAFK